MRCEKEKKPLRRRPTLKKEPPASESDGPKEEEKVADKRGKTVFSA